jgi:hypothetical protein
MSIYVLLKDRPGDRLARLSKLVGHHRNRIQKLGKEDWLDRLVWRQQLM